MNGLAFQPTPVAFQATPIVVIAIFVWLFWRITFMYMCNRLAMHKGYSGYWATGFFFGFLGLLYVHFLPVVEEETIELVRPQQPEQKRYLEQQDYIAQRQNGRAERHGINPRQ